MVLNRFAFVICGLSLWHLGALAIVLALYTDGPRSIPIGFCIELYCFYLKWPVYIVLCTFLIRLSLFQY